MPHGGCLPKCRPNSPRNSAPKQVTMTTFPQPWMFFSVFQVSHQEEEQAWAEASLRYLLLKRQRQEDCQFKHSLDNLVSLCSKI